MSGSRWRCEVGQIERCVPIVLNSLGDWCRCFAFLHRRILESCDGRSYFTYAKVEPIGKEEVACGIKVDRIRLVDASQGCVEAVAAEESRSIAGQRRDRSCDMIHFSDRVIF